MLTALASVCLLLAALPAALTVWNLALVRRPRLPSTQGSPSHGHGLPRISVLIPARDEARNIGHALDAVLASAGVELEAVVLDDDSSDDTAAIVSAWAEHDPRVRLIRGGTLVAGAGCGKPIACQRLGDAATGDLLVFLDADVRLATDALARLASAAADSGAALLSGVPRQRMVTLIEKLIIPQIDFLLYGFLPVALMRRFEHPAFGAACGQLIAVERQAYRAVGGHAAVASTVHDGIALARLFRRQGYRTDLVDAHRLAECRMYGTWPALREGFVKNAHEGLGSPIGIVPWTLILGLGQVLPWALAPTILWQPAAGTLFAGGALIGLAGRILLAARSGHPAASVLLHPAGVAMLLAIQWYALVRRWQRRPAVWKGRPVPLG